ncbi:MAG: flagellar motor switch protein FliN [Candidatus Solibacter sp.]|nr:flagellar motor switch protein FliN [Candidatus Solibacter sp.]
MPNEILTWLQREFADRLAPAVESMTGEPTLAGAGGTPAQPSFTEAIVLRQPTGLAGETGIWLVVPRDVWNPIGRKVLESAGIAEAGDEETRGTFLEVIQQAIAPLAQVIGGRLGRELAFPPADLDAAPPAGLSWAPVTVDLGGAQLAPLLFALGPGWADLFGELEREHAPQRGGDVLDVQPRPGARGSKTMDLLMEVELPVGVSFGRVQMKLRDAVKLTTGSIVELNRRVTEPVEVIVNNCVIARGEVVVVEGNYGVRIQEIVSREERLRTLF